MGKAIQIAFQVDDETLNAIDDIAAHDAVSRAEVLRAAVRGLLARRRQDDIDRRLAAGYTAVPHSSEERKLADVSVDGLRAGELDW